jgi:hypothetical protein
LNRLNNQERYETTPTAIGWNTSLSIDTVLSGPGACLANGADTVAAFRAAATDAHECNGRPEHTVPKRSLTRRITTYGTLAGHIRIPPDTQSRYTASLLKDECSNTITPVRVYCSAAARHNTKRPAPSAAHSRMPCLQKALAGNWAREKGNGAYARARLPTRTRAAVKRHCCSSAKLHLTHDSAKTTLLREDALGLGSLRLPSAQYDYPDTQSDRETITGWRAATSILYKINTCPCNCPKEISHANHFTRVTRPGETRSTPWCMCRSPAAGIAHAATHQLHAQQHNCDSNYSLITLTTTVPSSSKSSPLQTPRAAAACSLATSLPPELTRAPDRCAPTQSGTDAVQQTHKWDTPGINSTGLTNRGRDGTATAALLGVLLWAAARWGNNKCRRRRAWKISRTWLTLIIMLIVHPAGAAADPTLSNIAHMAVPEMAAAATVMLMAVAPCLQGALAAVWSTAAAVFALRRRRAWGKRVHILQEAAARGQASIRWSAPAHPYVPAPLAMLTPMCKRNKSREAVRAKALYAVRTAMRLSQGEQPALSAAICKVTNSAPTARKGWRQPRKGSYHAAWLGHHIPRAHSMYRVLQACQQSLVNMTPGAPSPADAARSHIIGDHHNTQAPPTCGEGAHNGAGRTISTAAQQQPDVQPATPPAGPGALRGGGLARLRRGRAPRGQDDRWVQPPAGTYCEAQEQGFCGAHAVNALLGRRAIPGEGMVRYMREHWPAGEEAGHYTGEGWFTSEALNRWLYEHTPPELPVSIYPLGLEMEGPGNLTGHELKWRLEHHGCDCALIHAPSHWIALVKCAEGQWYEADSIPFGVNGNKIKKMTDADWEHGATTGGWSVNVLAPIDAARAQTIGAQPGRGAGGAERPPADFAAVPLAQLRLAISAAPTRSAVPCWCVPLVWRVPGTVAQMRMHPCLRFHCTLLLRCG